MSFVPVVVRLAHQLIIAYLAQVHMYQLFNHHLTVQPLVSPVNFHVLHVLIILKHALPVRQTTLYQGGNA